MKLPSWNVPGGRHSRVAKNTDGNSVRVVVVVSFLFPDRSQGGPLAATSAWKLGGGTSMPGRLCGCARVLRKDLPPVSA